MAELGPPANCDSAVCALTRRVRLVAVVLAVHQRRERAGVVFSLVDLQVGLGHLKVGDRPFGLRCVIGVVDRAVVNPLEERLPGGLRQPDLLAGVDVREHPDDRTAVAGRVRVALGAVFLAYDLADPLEALPRDEHVPGDRGDAAGAAQASDVPVIDDLQVAHRHDRRDRLDLASRVDRQRREHLPLAVPGAAIEPPLAGHHDAVLGDLTLAVRHQGPADPHVRALDVSATTINEEMKIAAVEAIAGLARVEASEVVAAAYGGTAPVFGSDYIIPRPFDPRLILDIAP